MTIFTLDEINNTISEFKTALKAVSLSQEYHVNGKRLTRADLPEIRKTLEWLNTEKSSMLGKGRIQRLVGRPYRG